MKQTMIQCATLAALLVLPVAATASTENLYIKDSITGCQVWTDQLPSENEAVSWDGQCVGGLANGEGTLSWFADGKLLGRYQGGMALGKLHGQGILYYTEKDGYNRYNGGFVLGKLVGTLAFYGANGDYFSGTVTDDGLFAQGTYISGNGERYEGELKDGLYHGKGVLYLKKDTVVEGTFDSGKAEGKARILTPDNTVYDVTFVSGKIDGKVMVTHADGSTEEQVWKMDKQVKVPGKGGN